MNQSNHSTLANLQQEHKDDTFLKLVSYLGPIIIVNGVVGNTAAFMYFRFNEELRKMACFVYLSFVAIIDTLSLFIWNLDHFLLPNFNFAIEGLNLFCCRFFTFIQYFSLQSGGLILCMVCIDRYVMVSAMPGSFLSKLPFRTKKSAFYWSWLIVILTFVLNIHLLILNGIIREKTSFDKNNTSNSTESVVVCYTYTTGFMVFPNWDHVNLVLKCLVPFILMTIFNILLLKIIYERKGSKENKFIPSNQRNHTKTNQLTISLIILNILYLVCVTPSSITFGFFYSNLTTPILYLLDSLTFFYNSNLFAFCLFTNIKFRQVVFDSFSYIRK
jgi:hypothetical protein